MKEFSDFVPDHLQNLTLRPQDEMFLRTLMLNISIVNALNISLLSRDVAESWRVIVVISSVCCLSCDLCLRILLASTSAFI